MPRFNWLITLDHQAYTLQPIGFHSDDNPHFYFVVPSDFQGTKEGISIDNVHMLHPGQRAKFWNIRADCQDHFNDLLELFHGLAQGERLTVDPIDQTELTSVSLVKSNSNAIYEPWVVDDVTSASDRMFILRT